MKRIRRICRTSVAIALVGILCANVSPAKVDAETIEELQAENEDAEALKEDAQQIVDNLTVEKDNIVAAITELDRRVSEYQVQITELETQKADIEASIESTQAKLDVAKADEEAQYEAMKLRIQYSYENGNVSYIDTIFSTSDISDIVNKSEYAEQVYKYDSNMLEALVDIKETIAATEEELEEQLDDVKKLEDKLAADKEALDILVQGKEAQLANYETSIDEYLAVVAQYQAEIDERDAKIAQLEEERRKAEEEALINGLDVPIYYTGGTFQWPVSSGGVITSTFGPRWGTIHQGIDIACPIGTPILAGESGTVIASYLSSSAGEYIVIDHGGGVSTEYMHNSVRLVNVGDTVTRGQVIAYSGNTGWSTGPHCHFGVRINGVRVDPMPYLQ